MKNLFCLVFVLSISISTIPTAGAQTDFESSIKKKSEVLFKSLSKGLDSLPKEKNGEVKLADIVSKLKVVGFGSAAGDDRWSKYQAKKDVEFLSSLDKDKNGKVSVDEAKNQVAESLIKTLKSRTDLDRDGDGRISKKEYAVSQRPKFGKMDSDGLDGHGRGHFKREDPDQDGYISLATETLPRYFQRELSAVNRIQLCLRLAKLLGSEVEEVNEESFAKIFGEGARKEEVAKVWKNITTTRTRNGSNKVNNFKAKEVSSRIGRLSKENTEFLSKNLKK